jgi:hypothetical protein
MKNYSPEQEEKIIQIMPAPQNLFVKYTNDENPNEHITSKVLCLALTDAGEVYLMDMDESGWIDRADTAANFKGAFWENQ